MLHIFTGTDIGKAKTRAREIAKGFELVLVGEGGEAIEKSLSFLESQGLFTQTPALLFDRVLETPEGKEFFEIHAEAFHASASPVFLIEQKLTATELKKFPAGSKQEVFNADGDASVKAPPNVFAFTDAFLAGNRKESWIRYRTLIDTGSSAEEVHGAMMWAVRSMFLSLKTKSPEESGLKSFVYSKSKKFGEKMGVQKAEQLSQSLVSLYHRSRRGEGSLDLLLEDLLLTR